MKKYVDMHTRFKRAGGVLCIGALLIIGASIAQTSIAAAYEQSMNLSSLSAVLAHDDTHDAAQSIVQSFTHEVLGDINPEMSDAWVDPQTVDALSWYQKPGVCIYVTRLTEQELEQRVIEILNQSGFEYLRSPHALSARRDETNLYMTFVSTSDVVTLSVYSSNNSETEHD